LLFRERDNILNRNAIATLILSVDMSEETGDLRHGFQ
jgi:hypothetical protein